LFNLAAFLADYLAALLALLTDLIAFLDNLLTPALL